MIFHVLLALIAMVVLGRISVKRNAWGWIVAYWAVLVVKNLADLWRLV